MSLKTFSLAVLLTALALPCAAFAQSVTLNPTVAFSVHDQPRDGAGDTFNAAPFTGLLREQSTREDRAMQEFDLQPFAGRTVMSASISGRVAVNNAFNNGVRTFDFGLYFGNGVADLSDFAPPPLPIGIGSYMPPVDTAFGFTFDVTAEVQAMLSGGIPFLGLHCDPTSDPNFPNILDPGTSLTINFSSPSISTPVGTACGGVGVPLLTSSAPTINTIVDFNFSGMTPGSVGALYLSAGLPAGQNLGPCTVEIDLGNYLTLAPITISAAGTALFQLPLPNDPALLGATFTLQAATGPTAGPFGLDITNGLFVTLGL